MRKNLEVKKEKCSKKCIVILLIIFALLLSAYIVYTNFNETNDEANNETIGESKQNSQELKDELMIIAGINLEGEKDLCERNLSIIFLKNSGIINEFSDYNKRLILYGYSLNNDLLLDLSSCYYSEDSCVAIKENDYNSIAKKYGITNKAEELCNNQNDDYEGCSLKNEDKYILEIDGCAAEIKSLKYNDITYKHKDNDIIITAKAHITYYDSSIKDEKKIITYTFKQNKDNNYYLYSVYNNEI